MNVRSQEWEVHEFTGLVWFRASLMLMGSRNAAAQTH